MKEVWLRLIHDPDEIHRDDILHPVVRVHGQIGSNPEYHHKEGKTIMNVEITARHFEANDKIRDYARKRVQKVNRYIRRPIGCHVILDHESNEHITEINLMISGKRIFVKEKTDNLISSIDGAVHKLVCQVKKFSEIRHAHH